MDEKKTTLFEHLEELRRVIIISLLSILVGMLISYGLFDDFIMRIIMSPVDKLGKELVIIGVTEGFLVQLKIAFLGGIVLASPLVFWQTLSFILPALYRHEKKMFWLALFFSVALFVVGVVFAYVYILELALKVLLVNFSAGLTAMISVSKYVAFVISFLLPFGIIFQIPLITLLLSRAGIISPRLLKSKRGYIILIIFILAAVLSPGADVLTQFMLALTMLVLYELSILISVICSRDRSHKGKGKL